MIINDIKLKFDDKGLIVAIAQDAQSGEVLMQAFMNEEAINLTLQTGLMHYYSRSKQSLWKKGETSGHFQEVVSVSVDCDADCLLFKIIQTGAACHTGNKTCFYRTVSDTNKVDFMIINDLMHTIKSRKTNKVEGSYTNYLYDKGLDKILKKFGEESIETVIAAKNKDKSNLIAEVCDLIYHTLVLLSNEDVDINDILQELMRREGRKADDKYSDPNRIDRPELSKS